MCLNSEFWSSMKLDFDKMWACSSTNWNNFLRGIITFCNSRTKFRYFHNFSTVQYKCNVILSRGIWNTNKKWSILFFAQLVSSLLSIHSILDLNSKSFPSSQITILHQKRKHRQTDFGNNQISFSSEMIKSGFKRKINVIKSFWNCIFTA